MSRDDNYDDAEEYLEDHERDIKFAYDGRKYDQLTKTEQQQALLEMFFGGIHKNDNAAAKMRDGLAYASVPEISWIDHRGKPHIHYTIVGEDRNRIMRHDVAYVRARKENLSRTAALRIAKKEEYRGMTKKEIRSYNSRLGARQRYLKYSVVRKRLPTYKTQRVYRKHIVTRDRKGKFRKWH